MEFLFNFDILKYTNNSFDIGLGFRQALKLSDFESALSLSLNYMPQSTINEDKLDLLLKSNIAITYLLGDFNITLSPGIEYQIWGDLSKTLSAALHYNNQRFNYGLSSILQTTDFSEYNLDFAFDFMVLLNNSQTFLGFDIKSNLDLDITGGITISFLY